MSLSNLGNLKLQINNPLFHLANQCVDITKSLSKIYWQVIRLTFNDSVLNFCQIITNLSHFIIYSHFIAFSKR